MLLTSNLSEKKTELFSEHYNSLYSVAFSSVYSKIGNYHDAEDICQEVFLRFYRKLDEIESPRKWIFGALRLVVFDYYKRKGKNDIDIETMFEDVSMSFVNGFRDTRMVIQQALDGPTARSMKRSALCLTSRPFMASPSGKRPCTWGSPTSRRVSGTTGLREC